MAIMIPALPHPDCRSSGELEIFDMLKDAPGTAGWTVLHSLAIAEHRRRICGEADFVVLIPGLGVLVIEVKAANSIAVDSNGAWRYGNSGETDRRGPFRQASEAMHSIRGWIGRTRPELSRAVFWSMVIFPNCPMPIESPEWHAWQVIDSRTFRQRPLADQLRNVLERARVRLKEVRAAWFRPDAAEPTAEQCQSLVQLLRPRFELKESSAAWGRRVDGELRDFTEQQFRLLRLAEDHERLFVRGPAGSGKTFLALECASREALRLQKSEPRSPDAPPRVLLACYTNLLGSWLRGQVRSLPDVKAGTLHRHMMDVCGISDAPVDADKDFWSRHLPSMAIDRLLTDNSRRHQFDSVIVDEAQDLLAPQYREFLDLSLTGGLGKGRWAFFGDFERQALHSSADAVQADIEAMLRNRDAARLNLRENCRNTPRIAALIQSLGGLAPGYDRILRPDDQVDAQISRYSREEEQRNHLVRSLDQLQAGGLMPREIVVLSTHADDTSLSGRLFGGGHRGLRPLRSNPSAGGVPFGTIHAFKGLEARAVVVTDIDDISTAAAQALLYVGISRAQNRLVLLVHESLREKMLALLTSSQCQRRDDD